MATNPQEDLHDVIISSGRDELGFWTDVINSMSEALIIVSPERRILYGNQKAQGILRMPLEAAKGKSCVEAIDCPNCRCMCRLFDTGRIDNVEATVHTPAPRTFRKNGRLLRDRDGRVIGGLETFADITPEVRERTERARRESQLERERKRSLALLQDLQRVTRPTAAIGDSAPKIEEAFGFCGMVSRSPVMQNMFRLIESVANSDVSVLIEGESGTGKELVAQAIHELGPAPSQPYFAVNCATFTGSLLLSELFGHERGSFTGAFRTQRGKLELAEGGTLLLDEVSEIPIEHQALLLRVLECRQFERVGGTDTIALQARVISAANQSLAEAIERGTFRRDLYFRLNVVPIRVPPLRERADDISLLVQYFLAQKTGENGPTLEVSARVHERLAAYPWPGNVRELRNLVEYFSFVCADEVRLEHLPRQFFRRTETAPAPAPPVIPSSERARILDALQRARFKKAKAAELLGIERTTLWRRMKKLGIDAP